MEYVTAARLREVYLPQVSATADGILAHYIVTATQVVNLALGFAFDGFLATAAARSFDARPNGSPVLQLPFYEAGSLTALALLSATPAVALLTYTLTTDYEIESGPDVECTLLPLSGLRLAGWPLYRHGEVGLRLSAHRGSGRDVRAGGERLARA